MRRVAAWLAHDRRRPRPRPPHVTRENESPTYNTCIPSVYKSNRAGAGLYRAVRALSAGIKRRSCPSSRIVFDRSQPSLCFSPSRSAQGGAPEQKPPTTSFPLLRHEPTFAREPVSFLVRSIKYHPHEPRNQSVAHTKVSSSQIHPTSGRRRTQERTAAKSMSRTPSKERSPFGVSNGKRNMEARSVLTLILLPQRRTRGHPVAKRRSHSHDLKGMNGPTRERRSTASGVILPFFS